MEPVRLLILHYDGTTYHKTYTEADGFGWRSRTEFTGVHGVILDPIDLVAE
ncbi:MAG: hypothetical protein OES13_00695 [Acidimicrobiia bacterium]|nr:hypothetical protein [Acidimicrobiia bacterium]